MNNKYLHTTVRIATEVKHIAKICNVLLLYFAAFVENNKFNTKCKHLYIKHQAYWFKTLCFLRKFFLHGHKNNDLTWLTQRISYCLSLTLLLHRFSLPSSNIRRCNSFLTLEDATKNSAPVRIIQYNNLDCASELQYQILYYCVETQQSPLLINFSKLR